MSDFTHTKYKFFVDAYNIKNGQLSKQESLNKSVDILKKEVDDLYNRAQIIRGKEGFQWEPFYQYNLGELVWYNAECFRAKQDNYNVLPYPGDEWEVVKRGEYTLDIDPSSYLNKENTTPYLPTGDYHPSTKKYVDTSIEQLNITGNFLALDREEEYTPLGQYNPSTKKYVDDSITELATNGTGLTVSQAYNADLLGNIPASGYMEVHNVYDYNGMGVDGDTSTWLRTTANGLLPFDKTESSALGSKTWRFFEVHSKDFYGSYNAPQADIAEKYLADRAYKPGTILGIGGINEVTEYNEDLPLAGVVSTEPGYKLNSELENGIYIVLKGRVPVNIIGSAKKGDYIDAFMNGCGIKSNKKSDKTIGICLNDGSGTVEVKV